MTKTEFACEKFEAGCNCAQSTLVALASDKMDVNTLELLTSAFGGGISQQGRTCGVVTGALMALGLHQGYTQGSLEGKNAFYEKSKAFIAEFEKNHGSSECRTLLGYDVSKPEDKEKAVEAGVFKTKCPLYLISAIKTLEAKLS